MLSDLRATEDVPFVAGYKVSASGISDMAFLNFADNMRPAFIAITFDVDLVAKTVFLRIRHAEVSGITVVAPRVVEHPLSFDIRARIELPFNTVIHGLIEV